MSEKTLLMPHELLCNMNWLNHLDGISLHLQCPKVEASQPNKTKGINEAHSVLIVLWFNFVAVSVDFLQSGIAIRTIQKTLKQRCFSDLLALQRALQKGCTNAVFRSLQQCIFVTALTLR